MSWFKDPHRLKTLKIENRFILSELDQKSLFKTHNSDFVKSSVPIDWFPDLLFEFVVQSQLQTKASLINWSDRKLCLNRMSIYGRTSFETDNFSTEVYDLHNQGLKYLNPFLYVSE